MQYAIASLSDLTAKSGNIRDCLSAERANGLCFNCRYYDKCESRITNPKLDGLMAELDAARATVINKRRELRKAGGHLPRW